MPVLDREALEQSPLADLHTIASEQSIDGYRRLRKAELIQAILGSEGDPGSPPAEAPEPPASTAAAEDESKEAPGPSRRRGRRGGRSRTEPSEPAAPSEPEAAKPQSRSDQAAATDDVVEGVVELLGNGSGFLRTDPPDPSDNDVYVSAAQVKRCELVSGDTITGPRRPPRRSERFASLIRVDTVNGRPVAELAAGTRFDDLPAAFPSERFRLGSEDPTLSAIEFLTPFGRGSRVTIAGPAGAGKSEALRRLAAVFSAQEDIQLSVALAGVRPEEIAEWRASDPAPAAAVSFAGSTESQDHAVELVVDQARRVATRGAHAVVLVDTLDGLHPGVARKVLAAARNLLDSGSLTVIATASQPLGGETTVISLDRALTGAGRFPALDLTSSGTLRPALLVGEPGAEAIAQARAEALGVQ